MRVNIEEAIQEDVSEKQDEKEVVEEKTEEQTVNPRVAAMEEIVEANRKDSGLEEPEEEPEEEVEKEPDEEELITLKVDGKEVQVKMSEVIDAGKRTYQKETTADARLEEVSQRQKEIAELEAKLNERQKTLVTLADGEQIDIGKEFTAAMFDDDNKAADLLNQMSGRIRFLEDSLALQAQNEEAKIERAREQEQQENEKIVSYYHKTYDEIASDEDMHDMMVVRTRSHQKADPSLSPQEAIDKAAEDVNRFYGISEDQEKVTPTVRTPKRAGAKRSLHKPLPKPQTTEEILAEMQVARGRRPTL